MRFSSVSERQASPVVIVRDDRHSLPGELCWIPRLYRNTWDRTSEIELLADLKYPGIFERLDRLRDRGRTWPDWCWVPIDEIDDLLRCQYRHHIEERDRDSWDPLPDAARLAAVGAWRHAGRHITAFDSKLVDAFHQWPDRLPPDLAENWPATGVYVAFERQPSNKEAAVSGGVFLHLEWNQAQARAEFRLLLDRDPRIDVKFSNLIANTVHLTAPSLSGAVAATWMEQVMRDRAQRHNWQIMDTSPGSLLETVTAHAITEMRPWLAAAHYLCSGAIRSAASVLGLNDQTQWPPQRRPQRAPMMWIATVGP